MDEPKNMSLIYVKVGCLKKAISVPRAAKNNRQSIFRHKQVQTTSGRQLDIQFGDTINRINLIGGHRARFVAL